MMGMKCARILAVYALLAVLISGIDWQPESSNYNGIETQPNLEVDQGNRVIIHYANR